MPIYTYRCENCGVQFDRRQQYTDQPLTWCPECNKKALRKVYTPVGIVFKGSGFYATDHRSPSGNKWGSSGSKQAEGEKKSDADSKATTTPPSTETNSSSSSTPSSKSES